MPMKDPRLDRILELIAQIFGDTSRTREQTRELLETIEEDIMNRLEALIGDNDDEDKS